MVKFFFHSKFDIVVLRVLVVKTIHSMDVGFQHPEISST